MMDEKKTAVEIPVVAGPIVAQATPAMADATQAIAAAPQDAPIVLSQVPLPVLAATVLAAPAGENK